MQEAGKLQARPKFGRKCGGSHDRCDISLALVHKKDLQRTPSQGESIKKRTGKKKGRS